MADAGTGPTDAGMAAFLDAVAPKDKRRDALALEALFHRVTGYDARMRGPSMVGHGRNHYTYASGHSGSSMATGFSPRKAGFSIYILPGYAHFGGILARLGKHRIGKACLYVRRLSDVDLAVLRALIRAGLADPGTRWPVHPA